jgi:hypothetical protein
MIRSSCLTVRLFAAALIILGLSLSSSLIGCGGHAAAPSEVTITGPASDTIDPGGTASFTGSVTGGPSDAGVTWTLTGCSVSSCGTLSSITLFAATYTAPATVTTGFTVTLTATSTAKTSITNTITLTVPANPSITTAAGALASGTIGAAYSVTLAGAGGIPPYTWSIAQGALPSGLTLSPTTGAITGTPTAAGGASFTVKLTDSGSPALTATAAYTIAIAYLPPTLTTTTLPNGTFGTAYSAMLSASGGSGSGYTFAVTSGTGLSAVGLTLSPSGAITGTPSAGETAGTFVVKVTDGAGDAATGTVTLTVVYPTLTITTANLSSGVASAAYSATLNATGGSGAGYTWSVTAGASSLSAIGLSLSSGGILSGATPATGTATFTVKVTDSASNTATANLTVTINASLIVTTTSLPNATEGTTYTATLAATGGSGTGYTWSVASGTAFSAVNLTLSSAGAITGIPNAGETSTPVTVQVTDSANNTATATLSLTVVAFQGQVLSGTTPVSGATIQLYAVGSGGNSSAATPMLTQTLISDALGGFTLNGLYTCGQSSTGSTITGSNQIYLVATGGTTSTTSTTSNPASILVTAVGPCSNLATTPLFAVNELTTAAAAWALAPFSSSATNIGATSTNTLGITNAFLDAALLANPATGAPATLPAGLTVETGKLAALADALNSCTTAGACTALFTAATPINGTAPIDTFTAALNITHNPGQNVAAVYATIPTTPPFATTPLTQSPNDWTMSLTVTGGGLFIPTALGIDSLNNVWVADEPGPLSAFNAQGTPLSSTGFGLVNNGSSVISDVFGLAIDPSNNIWVTNQQGFGGNGSGSITEFFGVNNPATLGTSPNPGGYNVNNSIAYPVSIAADTNGEIYVGNTGTSSVSTYSGSGSLISADLGQAAGLAAGQNAVAIDTAHGFWLSTNNQDVSHFSANGTLLVDAVCCGESAGIATDSAGDLWIADYLGGSNFQGAVAEAVTDSSGNTSVPISDLVTGGISYPVAVAVDAAQNVWFANHVSGTITELAGINNTLPVATAISPSTGYGLDASLGSPYSLLPDRSGNLWVSNEGAYTVTMFFGLAAPTVTPLQPVPTAP